MENDAYVTVHRRGETDPQLVLHGKLAPEQATEEYIAERWGGGIYRCQEKVRNSSGQYVIGRTRTIRVAGAYKPPTDAPMTTASNPAPAATVAAAPAPAAPDIINAGILQLFQATAAQNQQQQQLFASMMQQQQALMTAAMSRESSVDWGALLPAIMPLILKLVDRGDRDNPLEMMEKIGSIVRQQVGQSGGIKDIIDAITSVMELKDQINPPPREADPLMDSIPAVVSLLSQNAGRTPAAAAAGATPAALPPGQAPNVNLPLWHRILLKEKGKLLMMARIGKDPQFCAEVAVEFMPPQHSGAIREFLVQPDYLQHVVNVAPELAEFPDWTTRFFAHAHDLLFAGDDDISGEVAEGEEEGHGDQAD